MMEYLDYFLEHGLKAAIFWLVGLFAVWIGLVVFPINPGGQFPSVRTDQWQAVFLTNDQVYFGKLKEYDEAHLILRDVYYLRTASELTASETDTSQNLNLIKLGGEVHGPEDEIFIPKSSVLYFENMKETSRVVESINESRR